MQLAGPMISYLLLQLFETCFLCSSSYIKSDYQKQGIFYLYCVRFFLLIRSQFRVFHLGLKVEIDDELSHMTMTAQESQREEEENS